MTLLWMLTALAATPEQLAEAAGPAQEQLAACAAKGCGPEDGARAAFLVALHTYQSEGLADGRLAATVRYLDPSLFDELPDVLRDAATQPLEWSGHTLSVRERMPPALFASLEPSPAAYDERLPTASLTVQVLSKGDDQPIPTAVVRHYDSYRERHRVHTESGRWTASVLYLRDGTERVFQKGQLGQLQLTAPGFRPQTIAYVLPKRKSNTLTVYLTPWDPTSDGSPTGDAAIDGYAAWSQAETAYQATPTEAAWETADLARLEGAILARAWMDAGGGDEARELCLVMGSIPYCATTAQEP